ncbi:MAG: hypothetical protein ACJ783_02900 [Myxococcales bacterium]
MTKLHDLAHCRAGDKGDTSILSLIAYRPEDYALLVERVSAAAVERHLAGIVQGEVRRFELPHLFALQFVCERALCGGVTTSLSLDAHGKTLSSALLELEIEVG